MDKWKNRWPGGLFGRPIRLWLFALTLCLLLFLTTGLLLLLLLQLPPEDASRRGQQQQQQQPIIGHQRHSWLLFEPKWPEVEVDPDPEMGGWGEQQVTGTMGAGNGSSSGGGAKASGSTTMDSKESFSGERDLGAVIVGQGEIGRAQEGANFKLAASSIDQEAMASNEPRFARNNSGIGRRRRRFSRAEKKPILNEFSFPANLVQGMRFVLMCQVLDGESPIQIKWFKDNEELITSPDSPGLLGQPGGSSNRLLVLPSEQVELVTNDELGASLLFRRVQQQHGGNYTCLATNQYGSSSFSSFMSVKVPPSWKVEPQDQHSIMGDQIIIDCQATGNPNPFIRWKFTSIQQNSGQLVGVSSEHDASVGRHQLAEVGNGPATSTATIMISGPAILATNFKLINSNHHVQTLENGSLSIRQAQKEHEGLYLCEADNGVEPNLVKTLRLVVHLQAQFADELQLIEPTATGNQRPGGGGGGSVQPVAVATVGGVQATSSLQLAAKSVRLALGASQMRILCQPIGDPPLTLEWLKDGQPIYTHTTPADLSLLASQKHHQQQQQWSHSNEAAAPNHHVNTRRSLQRPQVGLESELVVTSIRRQDAGLYTCLARNAYGQAETRLRLVVQEPPEPPELVDVAHIGSRSIALRWLAPFDGNSPIIKYTVEYRRQVDSSIDNSVDQQSIAYGAQSDKLMGSKSAPELQPAGAIVQPPMLNPASLPASQQLQLQQQQQQVQHTIHDLEPLAGYSMRVVAVNAIGRSRPSVALSLRTDEEVPSVVPGLVEAMVLSSKSIKLRWSISYSPAHEIIDGFFVGYRSLESPVAPQQSPGGPSAPAAHQSSQVGNVGAPPMAEQPTFTYKTIRLTNQQQKSNNGADLQQASAESESGHLQPSDSSSAFLSPVSSVTKTLPASSSANPFAISHHQATGVGSQLSPLPQPSQQVVVVSAFEYVINGLDRNTEYTILIQCFNRKGAGPTSDPVVFKTFMNDPPEKLALIADEIKESSLRLSWRFSGSERFAAPNAAPRSQEPVDGFVLTFAKVASQIKGSSKMAQQIGAASIEQVAAAAAATDAPKRALGQPAARISNQQPPVDQWQAIQLAPQQRSHQLKNLECGTSYVMKIWAFNKIGNGDPSELITVKTQGKAPIAPEKRALISVNSTQLRLHLSAWYDGGCEIDKFVVQYRIRGQQEWLLVSNNILRDQASVIIRDLMPATSYEILVAASNQLATTEARYRVVTLDADGKPVTHSFLGNMPTLEDFEDDQIPVSDYTDPDGTRRSERWPNDPTGTGRSLALFRNLMNSPMALILSLCLFVVIIMVLLLYKFNTLSSSSNSTLNSNKSSSSGSGTSAGRQGSCDATTMMLNSSERGPMSLANESPGDSPQIGRPSLTAGQRLHGFLPPPETQSDCQYQSFCAATSHQQQPVDYGRANCVQDNSLYPTVGSYGTHQVSPNYSMGPYSSVQRSATIDSCQNNNQLSMQAADNSNQRQQQQQCLMQMLMMGSQQHQMDGGSYVAALTTMARGNRSNNLKQQFNHQHPIQSNNNNNTYVTQGFNTGTSTLGRHTAIDYQRLQQNPPQQVANFPGKQLNLMAGSSNLIDANHHQSNNFSMATNTHQNNEDREATPEELYSMSTFTHHPSELSTSGQQVAAPMARPPVGGGGGAAAAAIQTTYCGSSSTTTSTSGCGTDGSADPTSVAAAAAAQTGIGSNINPIVGQQIATSLHQQEMNQVLPLFATEQSILSTATKQSSIISSGNSASSNQLSSDDIGANSDRENCDKSTSQYDVPFKFINHNTVTKELEINKDPEFGANICY